MPFTVMGTSPQRHHFAIPPVPRRFKTHSLMVAGILPYTSFLIGLVLLYLSTLLADRFRKPDDA